MIARLLASLLCVMCLAGGAQAEIFWGTVGCNCVPASSTTRFDRHEFGIASVQHAPGNVDPVTVNCPVTKFETGIGNWRLSLTYRDSTGRNTSASVRARLYAMDNSLSTPVVIGQWNSNAFAADGTVNRASAFFPHNFDFSLNNYWVRVDLDRSSTSEIVIFHAVVLDGELM
jgi:hypothetical protein